MFAARIDRCKNDSETVVCLFDFFSIKSDHAVERTDKQCIAGRYTT